MAAQNFPLKSKPKRKRAPGGGRKPNGQQAGRMLPWRIPGERYAATIEAVKAHAAASGRPPGIVIADAVAMLPRYRPRSYVAPPTTSYG